MRSARLQRDEEPLREARGAWGPRVERESLGWWRAPLGAVEPLGETPVDEVPVSLGGKPVCWVRIRPCVTPEVRAPVGVLFLRLALW